MPQLDIATYLPQIFWLAVTFIALYVMMSWIGLPRVGGVIMLRRKRIEDDLEKAAQMRAESEAVIAAYERALAEARADAQQTLKETTERLNAEAAERLRKAAGVLNAETTAAERRIAEARAAALGNIRSVSVEVARAAAAKLAGIDIDAASTAAAVDAVLRERG
jgi:F-type H+-transporting ATPase subunit b